MRCSGGGQNAGGECGRGDRPRRGNMTGRRHSKRGGGARGRNPFAWFHAHGRAEGVRGANRQNLPHDETGGKWTGVQQARRFEVLAPSIKMPGATASGCLWPRRVNTDEGKAVSALHSARRCFPGVPTAGARIGPIARGVSYRSAQDVAQF
jgi:hypothetical protein